VRISSWQIVVMYKSDSFKQLPLPSLRISMGMCFSSVAFVEYRKDRKQQELDAR
jgi:hypothetical protein